MQAKVISRDSEVIQKEIFTTIKVNTISEKKKKKELKEVPEKHLQLYFKNKYFAICIEWFHSVIQRKKLLIHIVTWMNRKVC